jgi:choline kinase
MRNMVFILSAGDGARWGNYLGVPKQLAPVNGEPILFRTIRLLRERGIENIVITVPELNYFGELPCEQVVGIKEIDIDKFLNVKHLVNDSALFIFGDVYFTENALDIILRDHNEIMFFGRRRESILTGKPGGEIFAIKGNKHLLEKALELRAMAPLLKRCSEWELYRLYNGYPLDVYMVDEKFTDIDDLTEDFDFPIDYDRFIDRLKHRAAMKLLRKYRRFIDKLLRPGSLRRRGYNLVMEGFRVILKEGWGSFWFKTRRLFKLRRGINGYK